MEGSLVGTPSSVYRSVCTIKGCRIICQTSLPNTRIHLLTTKLTHKTGMTLAEREAEKGREKERERERERYASQSL